MSRGADSWNPGIVSTINPVSALLLANRHLSACHEIVLIPNIAKGPNQTVRPSYDASSRACLSIDLGIPFAAASTSTPPPHVILPRPRGRSVRLWRNWHTRWA